MNPQPLPGRPARDAVLALQAARQLPVQQMISIAPPVGRRDFTGVLPPTCPWLLVQPEADWTHWDTGAASLMTSGSYLSLTCACISML